jgi:hypothetical protein
MSRVAVEAIGWSAAFIGVAIIFIAAFKGRGQPPHAADRYKHERDLLAQALGRVLVATGVANDQPLTGPQLLLLADDYVEHVTGVRP